MQGRSYHLGNILYRMPYSRLKKEDAQLLLTFTKVGNEETTQPLISQHVRSMWPIPITKLNEDPELVNMEGLAKEYDKITLEVASATSRDELKEQGG